MCYYRCTCGGAPNTYIHCAIKRPRAWPSGFLYYSNALLICTFELSDLTINIEISSRNTNVIIESQNKGYLADNKGQSCKFQFIEKFISHHQHQVKHCSPAKIWKEWRDKFQVWGKVEVGMSSSTCRATAACNPSLACCLTATTTHSRIHCCVPYCICFVFIFQEI